MPESLFIEIPFGSGILLEQDILGQYSLNYNKWLVLQTYLQWALSPVRTHIYIYIYTHIFIHIYICPERYIYIHIYVCVYLYIYIHMFTFTRASKSSPKSGVQARGSRQGRTFVHLRTLLRVLPDMAVSLDWRSLSWGAFS